MLVLIPFLTFGIYEVGMKKFIEEFGEEGLQWLLEDEVAIMP